MQLNLFSLGFRISLKILEVVCSVQRSGQNTWLARAMKGMQQQAEQSCSLVHFRGPIQSSHLAALHGWPNSSKLKPNLYNLMKRQGLDLWRVCTHFFLKFNKAYLRKLCYSVNIIKHIITGRTVEYRNVNVQLWNGGTIVTIQREREWSFDLSGWLTKISKMAKVKRVEWAYDGCWRVANLAGLWQTTAWWLLALPTMTLK